MHFSYPKLKTVEVDGLRLYKTPEGNFYPSITTMLSKTSSPEKQAALKAWQESLGIEEANRRSTEAAERGTAVHLLTERFLKNEPLIQGDTFSDDEMHLFNSLKIKLKKIGEVWGQEESMYSNELQLAGRCDCIAMFNGKPSIIDFKTSSRIKSDDDIEDYKLQLTAYAIMHNELFGTDIEDGVVLMASSSGFPQEFHVKLPLYVDKLASRTNAFFDQLSI